MKILVTGASGFTGHHMVNYLLALPRSDLKIFGLYNTHAPSDHEGCTYIQGDLCDRNETRTLIRSVSPDVALHLAGVNRGTLHDLLRINVIGTQNLLDAVVQERSDCRVLVVGSSAEYGYAGSGPITENAPLRPVGAYGISKVAEDLLAESYASTRNLSVAVVRPFNLIGPGQPASFVCGRIVEQVLAIKAGFREKLHLGNIDSQRDFIDVRDVVSGYWQVISHAHFEKFYTGRAVNIGSGQATSIREILTCIEAITKRDYPVEISEDPGVDLVPTQKSDNTRITTTSGWRPSISLYRSLEDMLALKMSGEPVNSRCMYL